ncbi:DNA-binding protein rif1 [Mortierella hygrophila]|uniref:DNA-binding protein rif1 n=1 Tax=Mortierella hygrophila TaxID=979708 RepID=A0A9P6K3I9_9FUNG|nr:DNA-binding protein rif1 [Mortierella hygrophila]
MTKEPLTTRNTSRPKPNSFTSSVTGNQIGSGISSRTSTAPAPTATTTTQESGTTVAVGMDVSTTTIRAATVATMGQPAASPSSSQDQQTSPSRKSRREEDLSYLARPKVLIQNRPPQTPLNTRFARPNTRRNTSPNTSALELVGRRTKRRRRSGESEVRARPARVGGRDISDSDDLSSADSILSSADSMDVVDDQQAQEQQVELRDEEGARKSTGVDLIPKVAPNDSTHKDCSTSQKEPSTPSPVESVAATASNTPKRIQEETAQDTPKDSTDTATNNVATSKQTCAVTEPTTDVPPATTVADAVKVTRAIDTDKAPRMPAQVTSVIQASPSRRVVFSPDKQESCLSIPNNTNIQKLKGILKTTVKPVGKLDMSKMTLPTEEEIANNRPFVKRKHKLVQKSISARMMESHIPNNKSKVPEHPFSDSPFIGGSNSALTFAASPAKVLDPFIRESIEKLKSQDLAVRKATYDSMLDILRTSKDKTYYDEIQESIRPLTARILIDLDHGNAETVVTLSVYRCLAFLFFERPIAQLFTANEVDRLLKFVLRVTNTSNNKTLVNVSLCCLGTCMVPMKILAPYCEQIIQSIANHLNSRLNSTSATNEGILNLIAFLVNHQEEIVPSAPVWLSSLLLLLVHDVPGIRKKALESVQALIPTFLQTDDNRLRMAAITFMNEHGEKFVQKLDEEHLKPSHEVFALRVWGTVAIVLGKDLHRHPILNPMLKVVETAFNRGINKNTDAKITAFKAWTRLIYSFSRGGHLHAEKTRKLILRPIAKGLGPLNHNRTRLAATNAWMALVYGLGPELVKNDDEVFFPIIRPLVTDESEHIRDLILRLLTAMFSNSGGADLLEGSQFIAPGSISFSDLGMSEAHWVRTKLLDEGLECLFLTMHLQHKITDASRDEWRLSSITGLPFLTQPCSRLWESLVRAVRDINLHEKGLKATDEAERAVSSLLYFIERVSKSNPSTLVPGDWPDQENDDVKKLQADPEKTGYIIRADIVHYLYTGLVEIMSVKTLVATRYKVRDTIHADIYDALQQESASSESPTKIIQVAEPRDTTMSPMEYILKCWLALGESVQSTHFESSFWQTTSTLVDWSASSLQALRALYRCVGHLDDIKAKRQTTSTSVWPAVSHGPISSLAFRDFEIKYWSIVAVRLSSSISTVNEITETHSPGVNSGYEDLFIVLLYPLSILRGMRKDKNKSLRDDHSQRTHENEGEETLRHQAMFLEKRTQICLPVWTSLVRNFYRIAQHKRGRANAVLNALATRLLKCYDFSVPYVWMQPMSVSFMSILVDTMILADPKAALNTPLGRGAYYGLDSSKSQPKQSVEFVDGVLDVCLMLVKQAYRGIQLTKDLEEDPAKIPPMQESAILLLEKVINKAPTSLVMQWIHHLHKAILLWLADSGHAIKDLPKETRQAYQTRLETLWNDCILHRLQSCGEENMETGATSGFGSVVAPPSTTIRSAYDRALATRGAGSGTGSKSAAGAGLLSRSSSSTSLSGGNRDKAAAGPFSSEELARLSPLLVAALVSGRKAIVNKTLEFWNETFGMSQVDLIYPEAFVEAMRPLKLVATVKLPGWIYEDSSQTETPQFSASMSQEALLSIPVELNVRVSASKLMKQKAELAVSSSPSPTSSPKRDVPMTPTSVKNRARRSRLISEEEEDDDYKFEEEEEDREDRTPTKRKRSKLVHTLELDPVNKSLVGRSSEQMRRSLSPDDAGFWDEAEVSTPTKQPVQKVPSLTRKEPRKNLPAPPVWRLEPPLQPYDPAKDDLSAATPIFPSSPATPVAAAAASPETNTQTTVEFGNDSEVTTMDMSQQPEPRSQPLKVTNVDVAVDGTKEAPVECHKGSVAEDPKEPIVEVTPATIMEAPREVVPVQKPMKAVVAKTAEEATVEKTVIGEPGVSRMEIDSQSIAKVEVDEGKSMSVLSQQSASNESEKLTESKSPKQEQDQETKVQEEVEEVVVEVKRKRGRPPNSSYASSALSTQNTSSPKSASSSRSTSSSPASNLEPRRKKVQRGSPTTTSPTLALASGSASASDSVSFSARDLTGASDESLLENGASVGGSPDAVIAVVNGPSTEQNGQIVDCTEFMTALRRVEEAKELLHRLDSRQLLEVQNQIIALNQAVCGVWSQRVNDLPGRKD